MKFYKEVFKDIYWVGANDRRLKRFENMFPLTNGVSYNSYLIKDNKNVVMDTVDSSVARQYLQNIEKALNGEDLDFLIVQHMEPDHCGSIDFLLEKYPECRLIGNEKTFKLFEQFYSCKYANRYIEAMDLDELNIGKRTLKFIFTPMVHWPEVMMTYVEEEGLLFSADAFGAFNALEGHMDAKKYIHSDRWMDEARRYYINIVGKHGKMVMNAFKKIGDLPINAILPLHGPIYKDKETISIIMDKYTHWASFKPEEKGVCIVFASMYGNTELAADLLANELSDLGTDIIRIYDVSDTDFSYIIADCHRYSNTVFAPINYNAENYHKMDAFLRELVGTGYSNRHISFLNNWSWGGKSLEQAKEILAKGNNTFVGEDVKINSSVKQKQYNEIRALAKAIKEDLDSLEI
ncbi:MAG: FprA family A-type flavoprotein [Peptoniphilaceae bacterium]|nr:FprA family A-type flavoprotein [Peptoniphilaceae bacterium]MDY6019780.1 FprA family A-type flavoprotein [Anaerococcus sp.]